MGYLKFLFVAFICAYLFSSCGDDSSSSEAAPSADVDAILYEVDCSMKSINGDANFKLVCNGDSVGIVQKDSVDEKNLKDIVLTDSEFVGMECLVELLKNDSAKIVCETMVFVVPIRTLKVLSDSIKEVPSFDEEKKEISDEQDAAGGDIDEENSEKPVEDVSESDERFDDSSVEEEELSGFSQKGPFVRGASVTAYELLNGRTLKQTGKKFEGSIANDDGRFNIRSVKLSSQYAIIVANGFYRNEVTGNQSETSIQLKALTNLKGRKSANINLLTHLEFDRVFNLVTQDKKSVMLAKQQAERELFTAFYIDSDSIDGYTEDLDVFGNGVGNGALLAISIMLQGDRSESEMTSLINEISNDFASDGAWTSLQTRAKIADWVVDAEVNNRITDFKENVESWNLGPVPLFQEYLRNFWQKELNLGDCSNGNANELKMADNEFSEYSGLKNRDSLSKVRFICDENLGQWRIASDLEKDTYPYGAGEEGLVLVGSVNEDIHYIFKDGFWRVAEVFEKDTYGWKVDGVNEDGSLKKGNVTDMQYVYDSEIHSWREAKPIEQDLGLGCVKSNKEFIKEHPYFNEDYVCDASYWRTVDYDEKKFGICNEDHEGEIREVEEDYGQYYVECRSGRWNMEFDDRTFNLPSLKCDGEKGLIQGLILKGIYYKCDDDNNVFWADQKDKDAINPLNESESYPCIPERDGEYARLRNHGGFYKCTAGVDGCIDNRFNRCGYHSEWMPTADKLVKDVECVTISSDSSYCFKTIGVGADIWMAENLSYLPDTNLAENSHLKGMTWVPEDPQDFAMYGRFYSWTAAMNIAPSYRRRYFSDNRNYTDVQGICPDGWRLLHENDFRYLEDIYPGILFRDLGGASWMGTDPYGINFVASGYFFSDSWMDNMKTDIVASSSVVWTSRELNASSAIAMMILYHDPTGASGVGTSFGKNDYFASVRCVKKHPF